MAYGPIQRPVPSGMKQALTPLWNMEDSDVPTHIPGLLQVLQSNFRPWLFSEKKVTDAKLGRHSVEYVPRLLRLTILAARTGYTVP